MRLVNGQTGKIIYLDNKKQRLARMRRRIGAWANSIKEIYDRNKYRLVMVTLTYSPEHEWKPNHVRDYLRAVRRRIPKSKFYGYAWVAELTKAGVPHYHVYFVVDVSVRIPQPDRSGMWTYGMSKTDTGRSPFYLVKYLGKEYQKEGDFPKGMRIFGVYIKKGILPHWVMVKFKTTTLPMWLREIVKNNVYVMKKYPKRREGGGWDVWLLTAEGVRNYQLESPWELCKV